MPRPAAVALASSLHRIDQHLDAKLLWQVMRECGGVYEPRRTVHVLDLVGEISDCRKLVPLLMRLTRTGTGAIRSRAVYLLVRAHRNHYWLAAQLTDRDETYRSHAIEGLLCSQAGQREIELLWGAAADSHSRVAIAALRVLHHFGQREAVDQIVEFTRHPREDFRGCAAWALGAIGDRKHLALVQNMVRTERGVARRLALRAAIQLRAGDRALQ